MDRDPFLIPVYCLVEDELKKFRTVHRIRHAGFAPERSAAAVIPMAICGESGTLQTDKDRFDYFAPPYRHFFPALSERSVFVRQAANLWPCQAALPRRRPFVSGQAHAPGQPMDTLPLPICTDTRAPRDRCGAGQADYGYCDAKAVHYYGFKRGLRLSRCGMRLHGPLLEARPHDITPLAVLSAGFHGLAPADTGCIALPRQQHRAQPQGVSVVTPRKKNMPTSLSPAPRVKTCARWRRLGETVGSHLTARFGVDRLRVHDVWHYQHRLLRKVRAHTVAVFLPRQLGRQPLDWDGWVAS